MAFAAAWPLSVAAGFLPSAAARDASVCPPEAGLQGRRVCDVDASFSSPSGISRLPRLKKRRQFLRVARKGRKWATPGLVLQAKRRDAAEMDCGLETGPRVGYTVSRKVGNAVSRNRAKRRLRAVAGQILPSHGRAGWDFVIIGRQATLERPFQRLIGDLETALRKLDCYADGKQG
jgi:ribonuclease P protein component